MGRSQDFLIVDGDEGFCSMLSRDFRRRGFNVTIAHDCEGAMRALEAGRPDHIILDLKLADRCGLELIARVKAVYADARIVVATSYASIATAVEAIKLGAIHYLTKPAPADAVLAAFHRHNGDETVPVAAKPLSVDRLEWEHINWVLRENGGNVSAAARALSMHRRTLQRKLSKRPVAQ
jgi:two-component system response regulator RegA